MDFSCPAPFVRQHGALCIPRMQTLAFEFAFGCFLKGNVNASTRRQILNVDDYTITTTNATTTMEEEGEREKEG